MTHFWVIHLLEPADGQKHPHAGAYLQDFIPGPLHSRGEGIATADLAQAKRFPSPAEALQYYRQTNGVRPDGKPNRPLTAWTVEILPIDEVS